MNNLAQKYIMTAAFMLLATPVSAEDAPREGFEDCEILLMEVIADKDVNGRTQVATYLPAADFVKSVFDEKVDPILAIDDNPIVALLCQRNDVIPTEADYAPMSTGVAFILSQDFDSSDTDSLTVYWKDDAFQHVYKGYPLSDESQSILDARLSEFSDRGIIDKPEGKKETQEEILSSEDEPEETALEDTKTDETETKNTVADEEIAGEIAPKDVLIKDAEEITETPSEDLSIDASKSPDILPDDAVITMNISDEPVLEDTSLEDFETVDINLENSNNDPDQ